ncbi:MAG TPA: hypothetical protein VK601_11095, partial [Kofleriaceae bacterium]|nr:hypothetical protein [Kofleriaceae bacterium]
MVFALTTALLWAYPRRGPTPSTAAASHRVDGAALARLRFPATRGGAAEGELLEAALTSADTRQTVRLIEKLGVVGSERALDGLATL